MSQITIIVGRAGSGKSTTLASIVKRLKRKTLIIDPGKAKPYTEMGIGFIDPKHIPIFAKKETGVYRVSKAVNNKKLMSLIFGINKDEEDIDYDNAFTNGNIIMEDAGSYINHALTEQVRTSLKGFKQWGLNLFLSYHSVREVSGEIMTLQPHKAIFKKNKDKAFGSIKYMRDNVDNFDKAAEAFYKAQFYGLYPHEIKSLIKKKARQIADDLDYTQPVGGDKAMTTFANSLSILANGQREPSSSQRRLSNYKAFPVKLRL